MQQPRHPVPMIGAKRAGFRYNRRDIQFDEPFEAVSPSDADILVKAKLARPAPPPAAARARAASDAPGDNRSHTAELAEGITAPRMAVVVPERIASSPAPPELGGPAKKKRVRSRRKAKAPDSAPQP